MRSPFASQMFLLVPVLTIFFLVADAFYIGDYHITGRRNSLSVGDHLAGSHLKDSSPGKDDPSLNEVDVEGTSDEELSLPFDSTNGEDDFNVYDYAESNTTSSSEPDEYDFSTDSTSSTDSTTSDDYNGDATESEEETVYDIRQHENWDLLDRGGNCGRRELLPKTIGGRNAELAEFPWMARLIFRSEENDEERGACGGSIISERYVLTAAHCCITGDGEPLSIVRVGEYDVHRTKDCFRGQCAPPPVEFGITSIIKHFGYNPGTLFNDICLLQLSEAIEFNDYVQPICLPTSEDMMKNTFIGSTLTVAGWGQVESWPDGRIPDILQEVNVRALSSQVCSAEDDSFDGDSQICAGGFVGRDACAGDSGGPLMHVEDDQYFLVGLVSSGQPCSHRDSVPVHGSYTRVSHYMKWILDMIG